jgi:hypothetical protein
MCGALNSLRNNDFYCRSFIAIDCGTCLQQPHRAAKDLQHCFHNDPFLSAAENTAKHQQCAKEYEVE